MKLNYLRELIDRLATADADCGDAEVLCVGYYFLRVRCQCGVIWETTGESPAPLRCPACEKKNGNSLKETI